jgi:hypothetical protein
LVRGPARSFRRLVLGALLAVSVAAGAGRSEEGAPAPADPAPAPRPAPTLEQLMKLPSAGSYGMERRAGLTRGEWRSRFARLEAALEEEERGLEAAQAELDRIAGSADQWLFGPPGTTNTDAPLDYRLRQEISRHKEEIERLERAQTDLIVEANLAGVPEEWRK